MNRRLRVYTAKLAGMVLAALWGATIFLIVIYSLTRGFQ